MSGSLMTISSLETEVFIDVNKTFLDTLGYTPDEVIGKNSVELGIFEEPQARIDIIEYIRKNNSIRNKKIV